MSIKSTKESFKGSVETFGGEPHVWMQDQYIRREGFGAGGRCAPICAIWIKDRAAGAKFTTDMKQLSTRHDVIKMDLERRAGSSDYVDDYLSRNGVRRIYKQRWSEGDISFGKIAQFLTSGFGYHFVGITSIGTGTAAESGHAIAHQSFDQEVLFDPNFGMAVFDDTDDFRKFFLYHWRQHYIELKGHVEVKRFLG